MWPSLTSLHQGGGFLQLFLLSSSSGIFSNYQCKFFVIRYIPTSLSRMVGTLKSSLEEVELFQDQARISSEQPLTEKL